MRKGTVFDLFQMMLFGLALAVTLVTLAAVNITFRDEVITKQPDIFNDSGIANFTQVLDGVNLGFFAISLWFPIIMILGFGLIAIFLASQIRSNPIVGVFSVVALGAVLYFAAIVGNVYEAFASTPFTAAKAAEYPTVTFFFENIVVILFGIGLIIAYVLHRQKTSGDLG